MTMINMIAKELQKLGRLPEDLDSNYLNRIYNLEYLQSPFKHIELEMEENKEELIGDTNEYDIKLACTIVDEVEIIDKDNKEYDIKLISTILEGKENV